MVERLLLTRARPQAEAFARDMRGQTSLEPLLSPMQEMIDLPVKIDLSDITSLAFTSQNGVEAFARKSNRRLPAYCVGTATAARARALGFEAVAAGGNSESLRGILPKNGVLHLHGKHIAQSLGIQNQAIYDQQSLPLEALAQKHLASGGITAIALFSPRSAQLLAAEWQSDWPHPRHIYTLSKAVANPLSGFNTVSVCPSPDARALLRLISADFPA